MAAARADVCEEVAEGEEAGGEVSDVTITLRAAIDKYTRKIAEDRASALEAYLYAQFQEWVKAGIPPSRLELVETCGMEGNKMRYSWFVRPMRDDANPPQK